MCLKHSNTVSEKFHKLNKASNQIELNDYGTDVKVVENDNDDNKITWKDVSTTVDVLCCTMSVACLLVFTSFFFIYTL